MAQGTCIKPSVMRFGTSTSSNCSSYIWSTAINSLFSCLWGPVSLSVQFLVLKKRPSIFNPILNLVESHNSHTMSSSHEFTQILSNMNFQCRVHNIWPFSANRINIKPVRAFPCYCFRIHCNVSHTSRLDLTSCLFLLE